MAKKRFRTALIMAGAAGAGGNAAEWIYWSKEKEEFKERKRVALSNMLGAKVTEQGMKSIAELDKSLKEAESMTNMSLTSAATGLLPWLNLLGESKIVKKVGISAINRLSNLMKTIRQNKGAARGIKIISTVIPKKSVMKFIVVLSQLNSRARLFMLKNLARIKKNDDVMDAMNLALSDALNKGLIKQEKAQDLFSALFKNITQEKMRGKIFDPRIAPSKISKSAGYLKIHQYPDSSEALSRWGDPSHMSGIQRDTNMLIRREPRTITGTGKKKVFTYDRGYKASFTPNKFAHQHEAVSIADQVMGTKLVPATTKKVIRNSKNQLVEGTVQLSVDNNNSIKYLLKSENLEIADSVPTIELFDALMGMDGTRKTVKTIPTGGSTRKIFLENSKYRFFKSSKGIDSNLNRIRNMIKKGQASDFVKKLKHSNESELIEKLSKSLSKKELNVFLNNRKKFLKIIDEAADELVSNFLGKSSLNKDSKLLYDLFRGEAISGKMFSPTPYIDLSKLPEVDKIIKSGNADKFLNQLKQFNESSIKNMMFSEELDALRSRKKHLIGLFDNFQEAKEKAKRIKIKKIAKAAQKNQAIQNAKDAKALANKKAAEAKKRRESAVWNSRGSK